MFIYGGAANLTAAACIAVVTSGATRRACRGLHLYVNAFCLILQTGTSQTGTSRL